MKSGRKNFLFAIKMQGYTEGTEIIFNINICNSLRLL